MSISENTTSLETVLSSISTLVSGDKKYVSFIKAQTLTDAQKSQARSNIRAISDNITLGIHSDGLVYIFVDGQPMGEGISMSVASEIYGYVADDGTIVVKGDLADGEYTVKYEIDNEDGTVTTIDIGDLVLDNTVYYSITKNLTNCTLSNSATQVAKGESFGAAITANDGYELTSVVVTMGGSPVTVSGGVINISNVTGNIVITAVAEEEQAAETVTENITLAANTSIVLDATGSDRANTTGFTATPHIDLRGIPKPCTIRLTNAKWTSNTATETGYIRFFVKDASGAKLAGDYTHPSKMPSGVTMALNGGSIKDVTVTVTSDNIGYIRFTGALIPEGNGYKSATATLTYTPIEGGGSNEPTTQTYTITSNLTNCTINNSATAVDEGSAYNATITANSGYELKSVTATMGGSAVSVSGGSISIASVTGDIVITAVATAVQTGPSYTNLLPISTDASGNPYNGGQGWKTGYRLNSSGVEVALANIEVTGFMPLKYNDTVYIKNITDDGTHVMALYDSAYAKLATMQFSTVFGVCNGELLASKKINAALHTQVEQAGDKIAYMRISAKEITANSIITVNETIA